MIKLCILFTIFINLLNFYGIYCNYYCFNRNFNYNYNICNVLYNNFITVIKKTLHNA